MTWPLASDWLQSSQVKSQPLPWSFHPSHQHSEPDITFGSWPTSANSKSPDWPGNAPFRSQSPLSPSMASWLSNEPHTKSVASKLKELQRYYDFKSFTPHFHQVKSIGSSQTHHPIQNPMWSMGYHSLTPSTSQLDFPLGFQVRVLLSQLGLFIHLWQVHRSTWDWHHQNPIFELYPTMLLRKQTVNLLHFRLDTFLP